MAARINEDGNLGDMCADIANTWEFNPLKATDRFGESYRFQDPFRGGLNTFCPNAAGDSPLLSSQNHLLQNLAGHNSILGKSISFYRVTDDGNGNFDPSDFDTNVLIGCCTIAMD